MNRTATMFASAMPRLIGLRRFARDRRGVSAVEFALLSPLLISLYLGGVEVSQAVGITRKVTLTAAAVANLSAQVSTISNADMANILNASSAVMNPYTTSSLKMTVSCLTIDANGSAKVKWSDSRNGSARAVNSTVSIPSALAVPNSTLIFSEVSYSYTPTIGHYITGAVNLADKMYMAPRQSVTVDRTS